MKTKVERLLKLEEALRSLNNKWKKTYEDSTWDLIQLYESVMVARDHYNGPGWERMWRRLMTEAEEPFKEKEAEHIKLEEAMRIDCEEAAKRLGLEEEFKRANDQWAGTVCWKDYLFRNFEFCKDDEKRLNSKIEELRRIISSEASEAQGR